MIRVEALTKDYGYRRAIDNLYFNANKGEILGFLGPNGAGKTTTMRILTGYMPPTSGKAEVAGFDLIEQSLEVRKRVGYVPETVPLYTDMTVYDYLKFMADLRHIPNPEERIDEVLERMDLIDRSEGYIGNLSKGMRQRLGLAQAILHQPEVLILDEPTIGLDPAQIIEVRNLIRELGRDHTVLLSTHILSEAQQVCNRVMIINKGRIIAEDTPERLQSRVIGSQRVGIKVRGDTDGLSELFTQLPGFTNLINKGEGEYEIESAPGQDPRPDIARSLVNAGFELLEMKSIGLNLEEIFLQLTRDEPVPPETSEAGFIEEELLAADIEDTERESQ